MQNLSQSVPVHVSCTDGDAHAELLRLVSAVTGDPAPTLVHACRSCGSSAHGRPIVTTTSGRVNVSLSRAAAGGLSVCAVCREHQVGIDVEDAMAAGLTEAREVACHPAETWVVDDVTATRLWVGKEALLKAYGQGLTTDPRTVHLTADRQVVVGPAAVIVDLDLGADWTCAVAVATETGPVEIVRH